MTSTITITFGDCGENHVGMQKIGGIAENGLSVKKLKKIQRYFSNKGVNCEYYDLVELSGLEQKDELPEAGVLVLRNGSEYLLREMGMSKSDVMEKLEELDWDKKAFMYGRVVNKKARHNLCFDEKKQEPDYENGKGRIISWTEVPILAKLKHKFEKRINLTCDEKIPLIAEGNYYYDNTKCFIGLHADGERRVVIGCRFGAPMPLYFYWFYAYRNVGQRITIELNDFDVYFMSEKAVGFGPKRKWEYSLKHAAGNDKFFKIK